MKMLKKIGSVIIMLAKIAFVLTVEIAIGIACGVKLGVENALPRIRDIANGKIANTHLHKNSIKPIL